MKRIVMVLLVVGLLAGCVRFQSNVPTVQDKIVAVINTGVTALDIALAIAKMKGADPDEVALLREKLYATADVLRKAVVVDYRKWDKASIEVRLEELRGIRVDALALCALYGVSPVIIEEANTYADQVHNTIADILAALPDRTAFFRPGTLPAGNARIAVGA